MMNHWGNHDRGPGGDPSWLGGRDRDGEDPQSGGWSSGFASDAQGPDSGVVRSDSDFGNSRSPRSAEQMAPRFGDHVGDGPLPSDRDAGSPWTSSFTGQDASGSGSGRSTLSRVLGAVVPLLMIVVFGVIALRIFGGFGGGFSGFGSWWIVLFIGIPIVSRVIRMIRRKLGD